MREIKFRAWDKEKEQMLYQDDTLITFESRYCSLEDVLYYKEEDFEIMQYTGLKDSEGQEIYEGDIYQVINKDLGEDPAVCEIVFEEGQFKFKRIKGGFSFSENLSESEGKDKIKYLGNKYKNPELLEVIE